MAVNNFGQFKAQNPQVKAKVRYSGKQVTIPDHAVMVDQNAQGHPTVGEHVMPDGQLCCRAYAQWWAWSK